MALYRSATPLNKIQSILVFCVFFYGISYKKSFPETLSIYLSQQSIQQRAVKSWIESLEPLAGKRRDKNPINACDLRPLISQGSAVPTFCPATEDKEVFNILSGIIQFPVDGVTMGPRLIWRYESKQGVKYDPGSERASAPLGLDFPITAAGCETAGCDKSPCRLADAHTYAITRRKDAFGRPLAFFLCEAAFAEHPLCPAKQVI